MASVNQKGSKKWKTLKSANLGKLRVDLNLASIESEPVDPDPDTDLVQQALDEEDILNGIEPYRPPIEESEESDHEEPEKEEAVEEAPIIVKRKKFKIKLFHTPGIPITNKLRSGKILEWVNEFIESDLTKIEDLGTGVIYCLFLNRLYPGSIDLNRIRFRHTNEQSYIHNFRLIQTAFKSISVNKVIPIHKLVKCHFRDNLEFAVWFKQFFDDKYVGQKPYGYMEQEEDSTGQVRSPDIVMHRNRMNPREIPVNIFMNYRSKIKPRTQISHLQCQLADVKVSRAGMEQEINFYLKKLWKIEGACQEEEEVGRREEVEKILSILYVTEEGCRDPFAITEENEDQWQDLDEEEW